MNNATAMPALLPLLLLAATAATPALAGPAQGIGLTRATPAEIAQTPGMTADYVRTPYGYFHSSCVQRVDTNEQLLADGRIARADGKFRDVEQCKFPHFLRSGVRVEASEGATHLPQTYNGYLQLVAAVVSAGTNRLSAYMTVPANPTSVIGQTLYFFPGLEDAHNDVTILQPVLGWNGYGASNWTIASWNCCKSGTTYVGNNVVVQPGDVIYGLMIHGNGQRWKITATDQTQPTLPVATLSTSGYFQKFDWVFAGALETYGVRSCNQFPPNGPTRFTQVAAFIGGQRVTKPDWNITPGTDPETACTSARILNPRTVSIDY